MPRAKRKNNAPGIEGIEAVSSKVAPDYTRARSSDGSFQPEFYTFGKGGYWGGEFKDDTIDKMDFMDVARTIAPALDSQRYLPARDPSKTKLLVMVYWGTTAVPPPYENDTLYQNYYQALQEYRIMIASGDGIDADSVLSAGLNQLNIENGIRDRLDFKNAQMLGVRRLGQDRDGLGKVPLAHRPEKRGQ